MAVNEDPNLRRSGQGAQPVGSDGVLGFHVVVDGILLSPVIRQAFAGDALDIARLHADSWRRHYRGAYSGFFLDGDLDADRLTAWTERLLSQETAITFVAEEREAVVGFVHVQLDADPVWGALVDNLHVSHEWQGAGIGTRLLGAAALCVRERRSGAAIYLWVLEQNTRAQGFYLSRGGRFEGREPVSPPGGDLRNLVGRPYAIRVAWRDAYVHQMKRDA